MTTKNYDTKQKNTLCRVNNNNDRRRARLVESHLSNDTIATDDEGDSDKMIRKFIGVCKVLLH